MIIVLSATTIVVSAAGKVDTILGAVSSLTVLSVVLSLEQAAKVIANAPIANTHSFFIFLLIFRSFSFVHGNLRKRVQLSFLLYAAYQFFFFFFFFFCL